jgi:Fe-S cluster assembly ATP-binding protein
MLKNGTLPNKKMLKISQLSVSVNGRPILQDIDLTVKPAEIGVLMGPNGSGKSSLAMALAGHPRYKIDKGKIEIDAKDITNLEPEERVKLGLFFSFQNPPAISGVNVLQILRLAKPKSDFSAFIDQLERFSQEVHLGKDLFERPLNEDFSGGEKKKMELFQALYLQPKFLILDEIDTGLDIDALRLVAEKINGLVKKGAGVLLITHYQRILRYLKPKSVYVLKKGRIIKKGGPELAQLIEEKGYKFQF